MHVLRHRQLLVAATLALGLIVAGCDGDDGSPDAPAQDTGTQDSEQIGPGGADEQQPPPGTNLPLPDTGGELEEPTP